jgi:glycosyltransferase involved in cell wall biosynthesis
VNVAVIVTRFQAGAGGVALRGALALDPDRYEITIIAGSGDGLLDHARKAGLRVVLVPSLVSQLSPTHDAQALRELRALLDQRHYDVVHTHSAKAGALGRMAAAQVGVPLIAHTFHGFPFHDFQSAFRRAAYIAVERRLARRTDVFFAVGAGVAAEAVRRRIAPPDRIRTIAAAIELTPDLGPQRLARGQARRALGALPGVKVVGAVGRLDFQKAPEHFVDAISWLDREDVLAVWVGDGPLRSKVEQRAVRRGLAGRFVCLGHRDDVATLLPGFDVFAMASRYEGLPCALVEAMSAGIPVVATAVNAVPDLVIPGETGVLVPPGAPTLLARAIGHLLDHPSEAARMATAGSASLGDRFAPRRLGAVLEAAYAGEQRRPITPRARKAVGVA